MFDMLYAAGRIQLGRVRLIVAAAVAALLCAISPLHAQAFEPLLGAWSGGGEVSFGSNKNERIKCTAYNTGGGSDLRMVIRCAAPSYKIEIRSKLVKSGSSLTGEWEERTYNATGAASGRLGDGSVKLAITGGGFTGSMDVNFTAASQSIVIRATGIEMKSARINLSRSGG